MGNPITPASGNSAPPDLAIKDCKSAMLYPNHSPLAKQGTGAGKWDYRATWAHVPTQTGSDDKPINLHTVVIYMHGHHNGVKVNQDGVCVKPDWATADDFRSFSPDCTPVRYQLAQMADGAPTRPIVLAPENTGSADRYKNVAGSFSDPQEFGLYIGECTERLAKLQKHSACGAGAGTYLPPNRVSAIRRLIAVAHSGGGVTLQAVGGAKSMDFFPSDLVQLDCLYGHDGGGKAFCTAKKAKGTLGMGNNRDQSRLIITTTGGSTETNANALVASLKSLLSLQVTVISYDSKTKLPGLKPDQIQPDGSPDFSRIGGGIMEIHHIANSTTSPSAANLEFLSNAMKNCPVVYIHSNVQHDSHPTVFTPLVVNSVGV